MEYGVRRSTRRDRTYDRKRRFSKRWFAGLVALVACGAGTVIYEVFFHVYDAGPKDLLVNGQVVDEIAGLSVRSQVWLSKNEVETLLSRIEVNRPVPFTTTKTYHGTEYVQANTLVSSLTEDGDVSEVSHHQIAIELKPNQHYTYVRSGDVIRQETIEVNGRTAGSVLAVFHNEATYVPAQAIAKTLSSGGLPSSWTGRELTLGLTSPASPGLIEDPKTSTVIAFGPGHALYAPVYAWDGAVYVPISSLNAALSQLGWTSSGGDFKLSLNAKRHAVKSAVHSKPLVMAFVPFYSENMGPFNDVTSHRTVFHGLALDTWTIDSAGNLLGSAPAGTAEEASKEGDAVTAMVTNLGSSGFDTKVMTSILTDKSRSTHLTNQLVGAVLSEGYDGVTLDFEAIPAADRNGYTTFIAGLASILHDHGKILNVVVPADTSTHGEPWNQGYDITRIGQSADAVIIMAYDYSYPGGPAGPIAPLPWVQQTLSYTVSRIPAQKVILGIDAYGYDWSGKHTTSFSLPTIDSFVAAHHIQVKWDATAEAPWYTWTDAKGMNHTTYYENGQSTAAKLALAQSYGIAGVALWRAGLEDDAILNALASYAKQ
ncbi:glycosyl hydrolase family 18 protein [Alicyclobacillus ferrooxydans]|uniref:GH18 domain-containing protein n=1 Tax=Alicyclobacillus ferrooxydans TaxID=471514 RepID=A0A0P9CCW2_9BACL|nr:glycosyl hydrolase family 18 protein [Alicyclobacillus ferrooxydans]KPV43494.1 hypothetical protein AN477_11780 [Alicyclobacillus ferrooxydans]